MQRARVPAAALISKELPKIMKQQGWHFLTALIPQNSVALFTLGGVASGKTTALQQVATVLQHVNNVEWVDMSHHNTDRLRVALMDPKLSPQKFSCLTGDEARLVKERELSLLETKRNEQGLVYNEVHDTPVLKAADFLRAATTRKTTYVCVVSTEAETALLRAYKRGLSELRFCPSGEILKAHRDATNSLIPSLAQANIAGTNTLVLMYDNNIPGQAAQLFGTIDVRTKSVTIFDLEKMKAWVKKSNMAISLGELDEETQTYHVDLYPHPPISVDEYFSPLAKRGYHIHYEQRDVLDLVPLIEEGSPGLESCANREQRSR